MLVEQTTDVLDQLAYETKMNVIAILEFILDIRLDFRLSRLISIFKQKYDRLGTISIILSPHDSFPFRVFSQCFASI